MVFRNPFFDCTTDPRSALHPDHPDFSPSEQCSPRRLFISEDEDDILLPMELSGYEHESEESLGCALAPRLLENVLRDADEDEENRPVCEIRDGGEDEE